MIYPSILFSSLGLIYDTFFEIVYNPHISLVVLSSSMINWQKLLNKDTNELFIKNEPSINENKLNKMTKVKLIEHAQSLNITIDMSKMLKIKIIELIMNKNNI